MKADLTLIGILIICLALVASWKLFELLFLPHSHPPVYYQGQASFKQIGTATGIYCADYDDRFPHTTAMPGTRAVLMPYIKNADLYRAIPEVCDEPRYNFSIAGSLATEAPLGYKNPFPPDKPTMWFALMKGKKKGIAFRVAADSGTKQVPESELIESLGYQFDRANITLAPPSYLANQDPLK